MTACLAIRVDSPRSDAATWVAVDQTGALLGAPASGTLSEAATAASGHNVVVLLPAQDVLRVAAEVPVKAGAKLLQALPFALEEQLAEDVDELHFAAGARGADGRVQAAVIRRADMDALLASLDAAGLAAQQVCSEADAVGGMPNTATLLIQDQGAVLAEADGSSTAIDIDGIESMLHLWVSRQSQAEGALPLNLVVYGAPATLEALESVWEGVRSRVESIELRALHEGALPRMAAQIVTAPGINLLQGPYARRSGLFAYWPAWRLAATLLVTLGVLGLAVQLADIRRMHAQAASLDATIDQAFHYVFPTAGPVEDARGQLSAQLAQLGAQSAGGSHEFLDVLRSISQAIAANGSARIEAVNYRAGTLELRIRAPNVEALDKIQQQVAQNGGLKAQIQSANAAGSEVVGRLQITRSGS
jgi:general secretion pathway protein L